MIAYLDTETTGLLKPPAAPLDEQPYVIDIGIVLVQAGEVTAKVSQLIKPPVPIPLEITKLTGISDLELSGAPSFSDYAGELKSVLEGCEMIVAHNAAFDLGVLGYEFCRAGVEIKFPPALCTVEEFYPLFGRRAPLTELYETVLGVTLDEKHRALSDALDLWEICKKTGVGTW